MQKDVCFSPDAPRAYLLPVQAHGSLRQARDQLRLYAQMVDPCSDTPDEILVNFLNEWEKIQAEYAAKDPFYKKVIDSQKKYAGLVVPFRMSWYPPYDFAGNYYWKDKVYLNK